VVKRGPLPSVNGDGSQLTQLFQNLISNSLKYTRPDTAPVIDIGVEDIADEAVIFVRDNGAGFDPVYATSIFEPFRRLQGRSVSGSGIGLSICKRVVERHGGQIWAESKPGEGSTFRFTLPGSSASSEKAVSVNKSQTAQIM